MKSVAVCAILGNGGWGTALAIHLAKRGSSVRLWGAFEGEIAQIAKSRKNAKYLPGVAVPRSVQVTAYIEEALSGAEVVVFAAPSQYLRGVLRSVSGLMPVHAIALNVAKGIEQRTHKRMSEVVREVLGKVAYAVLSGPSIAAEVAQGKPASVVAASSSLSVAQKIQALFMNEQLRVYTSTDVIGVELGGSLKNPIAIAAGVCDGLGLGANAKAALITRGVVEMSRLGVALGAKEQTFWGLSGLGDLVTTCFGGRNRWLGEQIGRGKSLQSILASTPMIIEGVDTAKSSAALAKSVGVELPIIEQVCAVLFSKRTTYQALAALMRRTGKAE